MIKWWHFIFQTIKVNLTVASHYTKKNKPPDKTVHIYLHCFLSILCSTWKSKYTVTVSKYLTNYQSIIWWGHMFNSLAQIGWYNRTGQQIYNKGFILVFFGVYVCVLTKVSYNLKDTSVHHNLSIAQYMMLLLSTVFSTFDSSIPTISVISLWSFSPLPSWEEQHASSLVKY